jgi:hypothetical protein
MLRCFIVGVLGIISWCGQTVWADGIDPGTWSRRPAEWREAEVENARASLRHDRWGYLVSPAEYADVELTATLTIKEAAKSTRFFGQTWSAWPDHTYADGGFEAGLILRGNDGDGSARRPVGYRVQLSHALQQVVLVKFPEGGYLRSVPCAVKLGTPHVLSVRVQGNEIRVRIDGLEKLTYRDPIQPLTRGYVGFAAANNAPTVFEKIELQELPTAEVAATMPRHVPQFSVRTWLGGCEWIFDGDEPILLLPAKRSSYINNVKLRPGYKPQLSWNSHWDIQNQGAYKEGKNDTTDVNVSGGGEKITASWRGEHVLKRFATTTTMTIGFDPRRQTYTYDVDSTLRVLPGEPFLFRYGYDFEHHTPLDPFGWQYLIARRRDGELYHRPVYPIDPGQQLDLATDGGLRVWYGRHFLPAPVVPAVEYSIVESGSRKLNTAVCAAFYDTAVAFERETASAGTTIHVKYRYTGYPADEAEKLFWQSKIYDSPMLDPQHHYVFAEWPKQTFSQFVPMSETWIYGRAPFKTGHNQRPTYELARDVGVGSGYAMKLGPLASGAADLPMPKPLGAGRYAVVGLCKADNAQGTGGRIEITSTDDQGKRLLQATHFVGNGTFDWKTVGFAFDLTADAKKLKLGLGNGGTGDVFFTDVEIRQLDPASTLPLGVDAQAQSAPALTAAPTGALADYRMTEGKGFHVLNHAAGELGLLETANAEWVVDEGRPALKFSPNVENRRHYSGGGNLALGVFTHPSNVAGKAASFALAGHHGGGREFKAFTVATWVKPGDSMRPAYWGADILGFGARRIKLCLQGDKPPYRVGAVLNFNDAVWSNTKLDAGRWYHLALTGEPTANHQWRVRLYVDGRQVVEGNTTKFAAPMHAPLSLVLATELFYLNNAYYYGLIGRTLVFDRTLSSSEIENLQAERSADR